MTTRTTAPVVHEPRTARRGRWVTVTGVLLMLAGLGLLGWVGWQYYGTTYVAQRRHAEIVDTLERQWQQGAESVRTDAGRARYVVRIPRFGDDYAVPVLEGTSDAVLAEGYGHFKESAAAGRPGNFALAAHRITHGQPLRDMPDLEPGDRVIVQTRDAVHTYVLDTGGDDLVVDFSAGWVVDPLPTNPDGGVQPAQRPGQRLITLTTCSELFHTDDRMVAFGHLVSTRPRP